jgi:hypothetical protein
MTTETAPLLVIDGSDMYKLTSAWLEELHTWLRAHDLEPNGIRRIEIREADGQFTGTVTEYLRNDLGHYCGVEHDHNAEPDACEIAHRIYDVPLTSLPVVPTLTNPWAVFLFARYDEACQRAREGFCRPETRPLADILLAAIATNRKLVAEYTPQDHHLLATDEELHATFAHPEWEYATTEGQRKAWDDQNVPPYGDDGEPDHTWERNVDAGHPGEGWMRFDYTEESYWRRRRPVARVVEPYVPRVLRLLAEQYQGHADYPESADD